MKTHLKYGLIIFIAIYLIFSFVIIDFTWVWEEGAMNEAGRAVMIVAALILPFAIEK